MEKIDFRKTMKAFYAPSAKDFAVVDVPRMRFVKVDGKGDPNTSPEYAAGAGWLYSISYCVKFASKAQLQRDYTVPAADGGRQAQDHHPPAGPAAGRRLELTSRQPRHAPGMK